MAVAVKNTPVTRAPGALDRLALASLVGVVYLIGSLALVFKGVPALLERVGITGDTFLGVAALGVTALVALVVLMVVGVRLLGGRGRPGLRAGIFTGMLLLLLLALVCRWLGGILEGWVYRGDWFQGSEARWGGLIAGAISLLLLLWLLRIFFRPGFEAWVVRFEEAGWFSGRSYKPGQGQRVRRGTIVGILLLAGSGIWTLVNRGTVGRDDPNWDVNVPFTSNVVVDDTGSAGPKLEEQDVNLFRPLSRGDSDLAQSETVDREAARAAVLPLAEKKLQGLDKILKDLQQRETKLRGAVQERLKTLNAELEKLRKNKDKSQEARVRQLESDVRAVERGERLTEDERRKLEEADLLKDWQEKLKPFRELLQEAKNPKMEVRLFLLQRDIDRMLKREREKQTEESKTRSKEEVKSRNEALGWIAEWANTPRLPVIAPVLDRFRVRDLNNDLDPNTSRVVKEVKPFRDLIPGNKYPFTEGQIISVGDLDQAIEDAKAEVRKIQGNDEASQAEQKRVETELREAAPAAKPVEGRTVYSSIVLLPAVKFTLPLLLLLLAIWLAWRIVNLPTFADFLISTEAEMNKVSWTTRSRLYQDTVVVLSTVVLMALFLFAVDIAWAKILSWEPIGVLKVSKKADKPDADKELKW